MSDRVFVCYNKGKLPLLLKEQYVFFSVIIKFPYFRLFTSSPDFPSIICRRLQIAIVCETVVNRKTGRTTFCETMAWSHPRALAEFVCSELLFMRFIHFHVCTDNCLYLYSPMKYIGGNFKQMPFVFNGM